MKYLALVFSLYSVWFCYMQYMAIKREEKAIKRLNEIYFRKEVENGKD